jgi:hypothetical protein
LFSVCRLGSGTLAATWKISMDHACQYVCKESDTQGCSWFVHLVILWLSPFLLELEYKASCCSVLSEILRVEVMGIRHVSLVKRIRPSNPARHFNPQCQRPWIPLAGLQPIIAHMCRGRRQQDLPRSSRSSKKPKACSTNPPWSTLEGRDTGEDDPSVPSSSPSEPSQLRGDYLPCVDVERRAGRRRRDPAETSEAASLSPRASLVDKQVRAILPQL